MSLSHKATLAIRGVFLIVVCLITYLALTQRHFPIVDDIHGPLSHILAFYFLALLMDFAFPARFPWSLKLLLLLAYGLGIEIFQGQFTTRTFSLRDLGADVIGVMLYLLSIPVLKQLSFLRQRWQE